MFLEHRRCLLSLECAQYDPFSTCSDQRVKTCYCNTTSTRVCSHEVFYLELQAARAWWKSKNGQYNFTTFSASCIEILTQGLCDSGWLSRSRSSNVSFRISGCTRQDGFWKIGRSLFNVLCSYVCGVGRLGEWLVTNHASVAFRGLRQSSGKSLFSYVGSTLCVSFHIIFWQSSIKGASTNCFGIVYMCSYALTMKASASAYLTCAKFWLLTDQCSESKSVSLDVYVNTPNIKLLSPTVSWICFPD